MMNEETRNKLSANPNTLYIGADVGAAEMKLAAADRQRSRPLEKTLEPFDDVGLMDWLKAVRKGLGLEAGPVVFVHEAGRDGFSACTGGSRCSGCTAWWWTRRASRRARAGGA